MNQKISANLIVGLCALLLFAEVGFAQKKNPTDWPYGGVPDKSRKKSWMKKPPLNFNKRANFVEAKFDSAANFVGATFDDAASFEGAKFDGVANFKVAKFDGEAFFVLATFDDSAYFYKAKFDGVADFVQTRFRGTVSFLSTDFRQGVDFRQASFDSVQTHYLENITFPEGELRFYWHQFQGQDSLRIKVHLPEFTSKKEHHTRIEIIYHRLRDNFLAQKDKSSADAVMYELGWQKAEILGEFWWKMYGWIFGWGYQPWRFLLFVVLPVIVGFAVFWYFKYYEVLQKVIYI